MSDFEHALDIIADIALSIGSHRGLELKVPEMLYDYLKSRHPSMDRDYELFYISSEGLPVTITRELTND